MMLAGALGLSLVSHLLIQVPDASHKLARSSSDAVEVYVDHVSGQAWCSPVLRLRFAFEVSPPPAGAIERVLPKVGGLLREQCAMAREVRWKSLDGAGVLLERGTADAKQSWSPRVTRTYRPTNR